MVHIADVTKYIFKLLRHDSRSYMVLRTRNMAFFILFIYTKIPCAHSYDGRRHGLLHIYEWLFINRLYVVCMYETRILHPTTACDVYLRAYSSSLHASVTILESIFFFRRVPCTAAHVCCAAIEHTRLFSINFNTGFKRVTMRRPGYYEAFTSCTVIDLWMVVKPGVRDVFMHVLCMAVMTVLSNTM